MHTPFSANAEKLSAVMAHLLGWTPDQFWCATPAELVTILNAHTENSDEISIPLGTDQLTKLKEQYPDG